MPFTAGSAWTSGGHRGAVAVAVRFDSFKDFQGSPGKYESFMGNPWSTMISGYGVFIGIYRGKHGKTTINRHSHKSGIILADPDTRSLLVRGPEITYP